MKFIGNNTKVTKRHRAESIVPYGHSMVRHPRTGAPPHFTRDVRGHLNRRFGQRWMGRGGPIPWPPRSPDLTPIDYFLWGRMKSMVYQSPVETEEELLARVMVAAQEINGAPGVMDRVYRNMIRRYNVCNDNGGRHIEPLL